MHATMPGIERHVKIHAHTIHAKCSMYSVCYNIATYAIFGTELEDGQTNGSRKSAKKHTLPATRLPKIFICS